MGASIPEQKNQPGQIDPESGTLAGFTVNIDKPFVLFDDAVDCRRPQAGAFAYILGGKKWFKQVLKGVFIHAAAIVTHS
jgi:hypothetical protein